VLAAHAGRQEDVTGLVRAWRLAAGVRITYHYEIADKRAVKLLDQAEELMLQVAPLIAACLRYRQRELADFIEGYTTERSRQAIKELLKLAPDTARVERDGAEREVRADQVARGDVVLVKPGAALLSDLHPSVEANARLAAGAPIAGWFPRGPRAA
jgi:hypothetical protein